MVARGHGRQATFGVVALGLVVDIFDVRPTETRLGDDGSRRPEPGAASTAGRAACDVGLDLDDDCLAGGIDHLRRHRALPDQLVHPGLARRQLTCHILGRPERIARGTDGLVGFLRVLDLARIDARGARQALLAVALGDE